MKELNHALAEYQQLLATIEQKPEYFEASAAFFNEDGVATIRWLTSPTVALNNQCPIQCELEKVKELLHVLEHGVYL